MKLLDRLSLEDDQPTKAKETEIVVYSKINHFDGLEEAQSIEHHLQYETRFENKGRSRVRRVTKGDQVSYFFTMKIPTDDAGLFSTTEYTVEVDVDFFEGFGAIATRKIDKTRYVFTSQKVDMTLASENTEANVNLPHVKYEIDVFNNDQGNPVDWCKIDIEIDGLLDHLSAELPEAGIGKLKLKVSHLPFKPTNSILMTNASEEQQAFVKQLWDTQFLLGGNTTE